MDGEIRKAFQRSLTKQGFKFKLNTKVTAAKKSGSGVVLSLESANGGATEEFEADVVLVSAGRRPFLNGLNLEAAGVSLDERGRVATDGHFKTTSPSGTVFAIGDVIAGPMLAHKAEEDGVACVENLAGEMFFFSFRFFFRTPKPQPSPPLSDHRRRPSNPPTAKPQTTK